jgi:hypothetical protein
MTNIEHEKEMIFVKLIRKGPHVLEFSDDYLMVHNGKFAFATALVLEKYHSIIAENIETKSNIYKALSELIDREYYSNINLEWYNLREYIANFDVSRLEELKLKIS